MKKKLLAFLMVGIFFSLPVFAQNIRGTKDDAVNLVNKFIAYYKKNGLEKALEEAQKKDGIFIYKDLYIFVHRSARDDEAAMLAHAVNPSLVGRNVAKMKDTDGIPFVLEFRKVLLSEKGEGWVDYKWPHPVTKKIENKSTFIKKVDDYVYVGCGVSE